MNRTPRLSESGIEYLDYAWNFYSGCRNKKSGICLVQNCWAEGITVRFPDRYPNGFEPTYYPEAFLSPMSLKKPSIIGCAFMGDLFGDWVDPGKMISVPMVPGLSHAEPLREQVFRTINRCPQHTFLFKTKCPWNLPKWSPFPDNCRVGVTVTQDSMMQPAYEALDCIIAKVKYISLEPYLSPLSEANIKLIAGAEYYRWFDWLILGAQTKPYKPPQAERVGEIVAACDKAGVPVFIKHNINSENLPDNAFGKDGLVRQELVRHSFATSARY